MESSRQPEAQACYTSSQCPLACAGLTARSGCHTQAVAAGCLLQRGTSERRG